MGSVSSSVLCPKCHMNAHLEDWYRTGSISVTCPICGYHFEKMYPYDIESVDVHYDYDNDGYYRNEFGGYGCIYLIVSNHVYVYDRLFEDGIDWLFDDDIFQKFEEYYPHILQDVEHDVAHVIAQTYFDGNVLFVTSNFLELGLLSGYSLYNLPSGGSWLVSDYITAEPFNRSVYLNVSRRNPDFDKLVLDETGLTIQMLKGFNTYDSVVVQVSRKHPDVPVFLTPCEQVVLNWDRDGEHQAREYEKAHNLSVADKFGNKFYPKIKIVVR